MNNKNKIAVVIIAIVSYIVITYLYNHYAVPNNYLDIYVLNKDVTRGEKISETDLKKITIIKQITNETSYNYANLNDTNNYVINDKYYKGTILTNEMLISKDKIIEVSEENEEIIAIPLKDSSNSAGYQVEKGSVINLYYSTKCENISEILNILDVYPKVYNTSKNGEVTLKIFSNISIVSVKDKNGNEFNISSISEGNTASTILIKVTGDEAIILNNLKNYGEFSVTLG